MLYHDRQITTACFVISFCYCYSQRKGFCIKTILSLITTKPNNTATLMIDRASFMTLLAQSDHTWLMNKLKFEKVCKLK